MAAVSLWTLGAAFPVFGLVAGYDVNTKILAQANFRFLALH